MSIKKQRKKLVRFMKENALENLLQYESSSTVALDPMLKYERIERYRVFFIESDTLIRLIEFGKKNSIAVWLSGEKLCFGFNHRENMRLSAYNSVPLRSGVPAGHGDRMISVSQVNQGLSSNTDRIDADPCLDVHGGVD